MSATQYSPLIAIIVRYNEPLKRFASRLTSHKHRTADIVKWALEEVYEQGLFYEGPHLRAVLIEQTKQMALTLNKALEISDALHQQKLYAQPNVLTRFKPSSRN